MLITQKNNKYDLLVVKRKPAVDKFQPTSRRV